VAFQDGLVIELQQVMRRTKMLRSPMNWFGAKRSESSRPGRRVAARPAVESLERREVQSGFAWLGNYTAPGGYYGAGLQKVSFFAEEVQGSFTSANAQQAWSAGLSQSLHNHGTLKTNADVLDRTTTQHFELVGWVNLQTGYGGWLAAKYDVTYSDLVTTGPWWNHSTSIVQHSTMDWMANGGLGQKNVEGPQNINYTTNGYHLSLYVSPDFSGNIHASFTAPS